MWKWLDRFLYGGSDIAVGVPPSIFTPTQETQTAPSLYRGRSSLVFDSHVMSEEASIFTEASSSKNPQAVSLAWDEGRAYGFNLAPQTWLGMTPRERKETLLSIFLANPWASNCIDTIALYIISGGFTIEPRVPRPQKGQRDKIEKFLLRINEDWDFNQWVYDQITDELIFGESFTEFTLRDKTPYQLFGIDCLTMDTEHDRYGRVLRFKQQLSTTSEAIPLDPKTIIRWWNPHKRAKTDPFSPLERVQDAILLDKKMVNWLTTFFQKGAKFNYYFKGLGDQDEADRFLTWAKANLFGEKNAQIPPVLWGNAEIAPLGNAGPLDMDFDKGLDRMLTIVLSAFHVPPSIACIAESGNRLTDMSDGQRKILQYVACDPRRHRFFEKFNYRLIYPFYGEDFYVSSRYADFRDDKSLAEVADIRIRNGSLLPNEARQEMGREPYKRGGDIPVIITTKEVTPLPRLDDLEAEQRQTAQAAIASAQANADLAATKAKQAKEPPAPVPAPLQPGQQGNTPLDEPPTPPKAKQGDEPDKKKEESWESKADRPEVLQHNTGMMLALMIDPEVAQQMAIPGGELANQLHITLAYLGDMEDEPADALYRPHTHRDMIEQPITAVTSTAQPLAGVFGGIGRFYPAETDTTPVIALVDIPGLSEFRNELVAALKQANYFIADNHGYTPHCTLAYIDQSAPMPAASIPPLDLRFDAVWLCIGDERIPFRLGGDLTPPKKENHENTQQETDTQGHETDVLGSGAKQSQGDGALHQIQESAGGDAHSNHESSSTGGSTGVAGQHKAELTAWIADLFQTMKERGSALAPSHDTVINAYAFSDEEQEQLAQKLAETNQIAYHFAYERDMAAIGFTAHATEEGIVDQFSGLFAWGREQVKSIVSTMREMFGNFLGELPADTSNVSKQADKWMDRYSGYKSEQISNVAWGTGANNGSVDALHDILDAATDPNRSEPLDTSDIRVRVVPEQSSSDLCADFAGKEYSISEYLALKVSFPMHPSCIHSIETFRAGGETK